jgi:hypothetical protein
MHRRIERGEEDITQPSQVTALSCYRGTSQARAERSFSRAALSAMNNPLAYEVVMQRDHQVIIRVKVECH